MAGSGNPLLWDEVAARHNESLKKAQDDYERMPSGFMGTKVDKDLKKTYDDTKSGKIYKKDK